MSKKTYQRGTKRKLILPFAIVGALIIGGFGAMNYFENKTAQQVEIEQDELNQNIIKKNVVTLNGQEYHKKRSVKSYLLLGTDLSDQAEVNKKSVENGLISKMADAIYLIVVDEKDKSYQILQLDRNTICGVHMLDVSGKDFLTKDAQLCTSFFYGHDVASGSENTLLSVSELLKGITINGYATFSMESIPAINNLVGGVTVTLEDDLSHLDPALKKGKTVKLTDKQASIYIQSRMNAGDGTNAARLLRQSGYIDSFIKEAKQLAKKDGSFINGVFGKLETVMVTNFSGSDFGTTLASVLSYENKGLVTISGESTMGTVLNDGLVHEEFYPDRDSLNETILKLYYEEIMDGE